MATSILSANPVSSRMSPSVVIIGAGNMAHQLTLALHNVGVQIKQVYNRSYPGLIKIADVTDLPDTTDMDQLDTSADIYLVAIKDDAIADMAKKLGQLLSPDAVVAHTSGSCSIDVFSAHFKKFGAFYPLQSLSKDRRVSFKSIPIFISSSDDRTTQILSILAHKISEKVIPISDRERSLLHVPAVFVNNFVNYLYTVAYAFCQKNNLPFEHLSPLMEETLQRVIDGGDPSLLQTGPAVRGDQKTISNHRKALGDQADILRLYNYLTRHIQEYYEDRT